MANEIDGLRAQVEWYKRESERTTEALSMLTVFLPLNIEKQLDGTVSIPIRILKAARDLAREPRGPMAEVT
jgi:hypothetical protein